MLLAVHSVSNPRPIFKKERKKKEGEERSERERGREEEGRKDAIFLN